MFAKLESQMQQWYLLPGSVLVKVLMCHLQPPSPFYGRFSGKKWPFSGPFEGIFQDHRAENS